MCQNRHEKRAILCVGVAYVKDNQHLTRVRGDTVWVSYVSVETQSPKNVFLCPMGEENAHNKPPTPKSALKNV
jgi:hypothetical protein